EFSEACRGDGKTAAVLGRSQRGLGIARDQVSVAVAEGDGKFQLIKAPDLEGTDPHIACTKDAVVVTVLAKDTGGRQLVREARCPGGGCKVPPAGPPPCPGARLLTAAPMADGILVAWLTDKDRVASAARSMVFYALAPIDALAAATPHPLFDNKRHGGIDVAG